MNESEFCNYYALGADTSSRDFVRGCFLTFAGINDDPLIDYPLDQIKILGSIIKDYADLLVCKIKVTYAFQGTEEKQKWVSRPTIKHERQWDPVKQEWAYLPTLKEVTELKTELKDASGSGEDVITQIAYNTNSNKDPHADAFESSDNHIRKTLKGEIPINPQALELCLDNCKERKRADLYYSLNSIQSFYAIAEPVSIECYSVGTYKCSFSIGKSTIQASAYSAGWLWIHTNIDYERLTSPVQRDEKRMDNKVLCATIALRLAWIIACAASFAAICLLFQSIYWLWIVSASLFAFSFFLQLLERACLEAKRISLSAKLCKKKEAELNRALLAHGLDPIVETEKQALARATQINSNCIEKPSIKLYLIFLAIIFAQAIPSIAFQTISQQKRSEEAYVNSHVIKENYTIKFLERNVSSNASYVNGLSVSFKFGLDNKSSLPLREIEGVLGITVFGDQKGNEWTYSVSFENESSIHQDYFVKLDGTASMIGILAETPIEKLQIQNHITKISIFYQSRFFEVSTSDSFIWTKPYGPISNGDTSENNGNNESEKYQKAISLFNDGRFEEAKAIFDEIFYFLDAENYSKRCQEKMKERDYAFASNLLSQKDYDGALSLFEKLGDYKDSQSLITECQYQKAINLFEGDQFMESYDFFVSLKSYKSSQSYIEQIGLAIESSARILATEGKYEEAVDSLQKVGFDEEKSSLLAACKEATQGHYSAIVDELSLVEVAVQDSIVNLPSGAFKGCTLIKKVVLPEGIKRLGYQAFYGCTSLDEIVIPNGVERIDDECFMKCTSLEEFSVPLSLKTLGQSVLSKCSSLKRFYISLDCPFKIARFFSNTDGYYPSFPASLTSIVLTSGNAIPARYFEDIPSTITSIVFPPGIASVGDNAFSGCSAVFELPSEIETIGYAAFEYTKGQESFAIPDGVKSMGGNAFASSQYKTVFLPSSIVSLGYGIFVSSEVTSINYSGSKDQWLAISKNGWDRGIKSSCILTCADATYSFKTAKWTEL